MGSERAWLERRLEKALEAEQAACDRAQSLERQCETLDEEVSTPLCSLMVPLCLEAANPWFQFDLEIPPVLDAFWVAG